MPDEMNKREVILTIREYENSVAMPEGERVTYLDPRGGVHLKDGDDKASDYTGHAASPCRPTPEPVPCLQVSLCRSPLKP